MGKQTDLLADAATAAYNAQAAPKLTEALQREFWCYSPADYVLNVVDLDEYERGIHDEGFGTPERRAVRIADVQAIGTIERQMQHSGSASATIGRTKHGMMPPPTSAMRLGC